MKAMTIFSCFQLVLAPSAATGPAGRQGDGLLVKSVAGWAGSREREVSMSSLVSALSGRLDSFIGRLTRTD